ncbi:MAG: NAD-dependent epimerase/dehydratase family protein [Micromonosporaceae bacterium]|nr:NAD-dependent epimerase/dehydratase family protein [Micromonosporaceae bacterium]
MTTTVDTAGRPVPAERVPAYDRPTRRAVVVGAAGFIGARLTAALTRSPVDTAGITRMSSFLCGSRLSYPLRGARIVYYLASTINPTLGEQHPDWAAADHQLFAALLRQLAREPVPPTVVLTSSGGTVYDHRQPPPYSEDSPVHAVGRYGAAKQALEEELFGYAGVVPGVVLRLGNAYGPGQSTTKGQGVLGYWLQSARQGLPLRAIGDLEATRDYIYIDDVIECISLLDEADQRGAFADAQPRVLNVASGVPTSLAQLLEVVKHVVGRNLLVQRLPGRELDRRHVWLRVDRAAELLGWRPRTTLTAGVWRTWHGPEAPPQAGTA